MSRIELGRLEELATRALIAGNTSQDNARIVAEALVAADADGIASHGVSRVPFYADQAARGKVNGHARPVIDHRTRAVVHVDAGDGFAFPAIRAGLDAAVPRAAELGVTVMTVGNSHHCGVLGHHAERVAEQGRICLGLANTPAGIAPWGGAVGSFGTNPVAFACPRAGHAPLVVDLSLSAVARGKVMLAQKRGETIPEGWALDDRGSPTTDPAAALAGTMVPLGGAKGAALAMTVEILTAALAGANLAFEASSFFTADGPPPRTAQTFVLLSPDAFGGEAFAERVETLLHHVASQSGTRVPGERRLARRALARDEGVDIPDPLMSDLQARAA